MKYFDEEDLITEYEKQLQKKDNEIERLKADYQQANDIIVEQTNKIENLTNDLEREKSQVKEYGTRLLKAIKYIETKWNNDSYFDDIDNCLKFLEISEYDKEDLLSILNGDDKDGKN